MTLMSKAKVHIYIFFLSKTKKNILIEEKIQEKEEIQEKEKKPREANVVTFAQASLIYIRYLPIKKKKKENSFEYLLVELLKLFCVSMCLQHLNT